MYKEITQDDIDAYAKHYAAYTDIRCDILDSAQLAWSDFYKWAEITEIEGLDPEAFVASRISASRDSICFEAAYNNGDDDPVYYYMPIYVLTDEHWRTKWNRENTEKETKRQERITYLQLHKKYHEAFGLPIISAFRLTSEEATIRQRDESV